MDDRRPRCYPCCVAAYARCVAKRIIEWREERSEMSEMIELGLLHEEHFRNNPISGTVVQHL